MLNGISPTPWVVQATGGARTIVAADRSVVAIVVGSNGAAPFEVGNGDLMAASPDLRDVLREWLDVADVSLENVERVCVQFYEETGRLAPGKSVPMEMHETEAQHEERHTLWHEWTRKRRDALLAKAKAALKKAGSVGR